MILAISWVIFVILCDLFSKCTIIVISVSLSGDYCYLMDDSCDFMDDSCDFMGDNCDSLRFVLKTYDIV